MLSAIEADKNVTFTTHKSPTPPYKEDKPDSNQDYLISSLMLKYHIERSLLVFFVLNLNLLIFLNKITVFCSVSKSYLSSYILNSLIRVNRPSKSYENPSLPHNSSRMVLYIAGLSIVYHLLLHIGTHQNDLSHAYLLYPQIF